MDTHRTPSVEGEGEEEHTSTAQRRSPGECDAKTCHSSQHTAEQLLVGATRFDGNKTKYVGWKREMQEDVLPGRSLSSQIHLMEEYLPHKNLGAQFDNQQEI